MTEATNFCASLWKNRRLPNETDRDAQAIPAPEECDLELLTRERLIARWCGHGSDAFFWRAERTGTLVPQRSGGLVRYTWAVVFACEGGPPPPGMEAAYRRDLLTPQDVARLCACAPGWIYRHVRSGKLPTRRVGRSRLFVGAEVAAWQAMSWTRRR